MKRIGLERVTCYCEWGK